MQRNQNVIITGAAGFIGSHLARTLVNEGRSVVGIDNFDPFYPRAAKEHNLKSIRGRTEPAGTFRLVEADIRDRQTIEQVFQGVRPDLIVHIAALAGVRPSNRQPARFAEVNVNGLANVLQAARDAECSRILFASSSSVYGNNSKVPFSEADPVDHPISPYAATKRAGELLCHAHANLTDAHVACLRFFTVYGPRQRPDLAIAQFMSLMAAGQPVQMFGDGTSSRDYTYIDDVIAGLLAAERAIESPEFAPFRIWNLGGSSPVTLREMIDAVASVVGIEPVIEQLPMQPGDVDRTWADVSRSERELGYRPTVPFDEGLRRQWAAAQSPSEVTG